MAEAPMAQSRSQMTYPWPFLLACKLLGRHGGQTDYRSNVRACRYLSPSTDSSQRLQQKPESQCECGNYPDEHRWEFIECSRL